jgi:hypothetical protein
VLTGASRVRRFTKVSMRNVVGAWSKLKHLKQRAKAAGSHAAAATLVDKVAAEVARHGPQQQQGASSTTTTRPRAQAQASSPMLTRGRLCHAIISALRWQRSSCPVAHLQYR